MPNQLAAILLAGGNSTRMGSNKALLEVEGMMMFEKVLNEIEKITPHIFISSNQKLPLKKIYPVIPDSISNKGPMGGIYSVLEQSNFDNYIVVSCDAPFIKKELIDLLLNEHCNTAVVPVWENKMYPFPGIYSRSIKNILQEQLKKNQLKMKDLLNFIQAKEVEIYSSLKWMNKNIFLNINTPQEYKAISVCN
ncbi:MAG: molybdenum cofactor guanylyltransferase [Flavobacteriales bacterium]|nr:molybdenum cofactor guanylyltransferase [Flavobacteriales bacterium]